MEIMAGYTDSQKPAIAPYSTLQIAILTVADSIFLTNLQKRGKPQKRSPP